MKHVIAVLLAATLMSSPAWATTPEAAPIVSLDAALIAVMKAGSANASYQSRYDELAPQVEKTLNLSVILQNSVGVLWPTLPADQQQQLESVFEQFTVASYVNGFSSYSGQQIQLLPNERSLGAKKIVETQIVPADGGSPTRLDYVMTDTPDSGWQATDVLLNGTISKVAIQSSDFSSLVSSGDASQLIAALKSKVATLSGGAPQD
jgi:phospholipid transport system substrate-binding protein